MTNLTCSSTGAPHEATTRASKEQVAHETLCKFIQISIQKNNQNNVSRLVSELDCISSYKPDSIRKWYMALCDSVKLLQLDRHRDLWSVIFERFRWDFPKRTLEAYCRFCTLLISYHPRALKLVVQSCCAHFIDRFDEEKCEASENIAKDVGFGMIHHLLRQLHVNRPTMGGLLIEALVELFPDTLSASAESIGGYVQQLLTVVEYVPELRPQVMRVIVEKMLLLDVEIEKRDAINDTDAKHDEDDDDNDENIDDEEEEEEEEETEEDEDLFTRNLDHLMYIMFDYIKLMAEHDDKSVTQLYHIMYRVFETSILSTHEVASVQYLMFYLCSFRTTLAEEFVSRLMRVCTDTSRATHERCFAAAYLGGFVSKAKYLRHMSAFSTFDILVRWLVAYVELYKKRCPFVSSIGFGEAKNHGLFYAVCQAVFRMYAHHQHTFDSMLQSNASIAGYIYAVSRSCLQPFKFCHGLLVVNFVLSVRKSSALDLSHFPAFGSSKNICLASTTFTNWNLFPFDSYHLANSAHYLDGLVRLCGAMSPLRMDEEHSDDEDDDDIIQSMSQQIKPSDALTPSMGPITPCRNDTDDDQLSSDQDDEFLI